MTMPILPLLQITGPTTEPGFGFWLLATVIKLAMVLPRHWRPWIFGALAFVGVGVMRWPLLWVMGALAPWAVFAAWKEQE